MLHQNWMRDYDPTTGRYLQGDPLGLVDGASVYGYALQNPGRYVDFMGLEAGVLIWGGAGMGQSSQGHASAVVDDNVYTFGPDCEGSCQTRSLDEHLKKNGFRDGDMLTLNLNSIEEFYFEMCLQRKMSGSYNLFNNNCTDPIEECLAELLYFVEDSIFPHSLKDSLMEVPGLVESSRYLPQSRPKDGYTAPWTK